MTSVNKTKIKEMLSKANERYGSVYLYKDKFMLYILPEKGRSIVKEVIPNAVEYVKLYNNNGGGFLIIDDFAYEIRGNSREEAIVSKYEQDYLNRAPQPQ